MVASSSGTVTHALPREGAVVLGRDESCDLAIDDLTVSRRHARIDIAGGGELSIVDLGSSNGTFVAGRRIDADYSAPLVVGTVVGIGNATLIVQGAASFARLRPLRSHAYFEARIEDECVRAGGTGQRFTIVRLECQASVRVEGTLAQWLRPMDVVASFAPNVYEILFVDMARKPATALVDRMRAHLDGLGARTSATFAAFPDDAESPEVLLELLEHRDRKQIAFVRSGTLEKLGPSIERVAMTTDGVLLVGETGTGKEALARHIHARSTRAKRPFCVISCASVPDRVLQTELLGYERGAFAGAFVGETGLLEKAEGGTVFLDEIAEMPAQTQATLLHVIETGSVMRMGSNKPKPIDVRFLASTCRDLEEEVACGGFREDLYFKLASITVRVPPLRERTGDIELLAQAFLKRACQRLEKKPLAFSRAALDVLRTYAWPGNARELKNVVDRAAHLCKSGEVEPEHLPLAKMGRVLREPPARPPVPPRLRDDRPTLVPRRPMGSAPPDARAPRTRDHRLLDAKSERTRIQQALDACSGNQTQAARILGMSRRTLLNRLEEYGLPRPRKHRRS